MSTKPETRLRQQIKAKLEKEYPGFWFHIHGNMYTMKGLPDLIGCVGGRFIAFEIKTSGGGTATNLQRYTLERIERSGGISAVIRSYEEADAILRAIQPDQ